MQASPEACPALVLNADFRPLSYFPLSLWPWQEVVKAVFLDRVNIISEYENEVHSPSFTMRLPSVISLKEFVQQSRRPAFTRFNVFLRDRFRCQYCADTFPTPRADVRPRGAALARRPDQLAQRGDGVPDLQPAQRQSPAARGGHAPTEKAAAADALTSCRRTVEPSRQTICTRVGGISFTGTPCSKRAEPPSTHLVLSSRPSSPRVRLRAPRRTRCAEPGPMRPASVAATAQWVPGRALAACPG